MLQLKEVYRDQYIYISLINKHVMGRFIDPVYIPWLYRKYPDLFDYEIEESVEEDEFFQGIKEKEDYVISKRNRK